jgi:hypothetical protein
VTTRIRAAVLGAIAIVSGCSGSGSVSGRVTLNDQPLTSGTVTFHPTGTGPAGIGTIGPDGRYQVSVGKDKSLPPGDYLVTVEATEAVSSGEWPATKGPPPPPKAPKRITPAKYADRGTTDLKFTVKSGENKIDLVLKSP